MTLTVEIDDITITVEVTAGPQPATWGYDGGTPAEGPEWDVLSCCDADGEDVPLPRGANRVIAEAVTLEIEDGRRHGGGDYED